MFFVVQVTIAISHLKEYRCLKNLLHQIDSKNKMVVLFSKFYGKIWIGFCLETKKYFSLEASF